MGYGAQDDASDDMQVEETTTESDSLNFPTVFEVIDADCLDEALRLKQQLGLNPVVLNMASAKRPGGGSLVLQTDNFHIFNLTKRAFLGLGYENGAGAQEENLFRRTNLAFVLADIEGFDRKRKWHYPLPEFSSVYTPRAFVLRSSEQTGYAFLPQPVEMAFVAVAAYAHPATSTKRDGSVWLTQKMAERTERKIRGLLYARSAEICLT